MLRESRRFSSRERISIQSIGTHNLNPIDRNSHLASVSVISGFASSAHKSLSVLLRRHPIQHQLTECAFNRVRPLHCGTCAGATLSQFGAQRRISEEAALAVLASDTRRVVLRKGGRGSRLEDNSGFGHLLDLPDSPDSVPSLGRSCPNVPDTRTSCKCRHTTDCPRVGIRPHTSRNCSPRSVPDTYKPAIGVIDLSDQK